MSNIWRVHPPDPHIIYAHSTVTPALQAVVRRVRKGPYVAVVQLPRATAEKRIAILQDRYPSTQCADLTRSALRHLNLPAVSMVIMPPRQDSITVLLLSNCPADEREVWHPTLSKDSPLEWSHYALTTVAWTREDCQGYRVVQDLPPAKQRQVTWRLSEKKRVEYKETITHLIHSHRPGSSRRLSKRAQISKPETIRTIPGIRRGLEQLGHHLSHYPGFSGVRTDIWLLEAHMQRLWRRQHPNHAPPEWPRRATATYVPSLELPLADLLKKIASEGEKNA